jgi:serine protease Do
MRHLVPRRKAMADGEWRMANGGCFFVFPSISDFLSIHYPPSSILRFPILACLCLTFATSVQAQTSSPTAWPAALERPEGTRPEQREALRQELDRNATVLDAQSAVVKIVAKLIAPSVVHIESDIPSESGSSYHRGRSVEEAGSGVIIETGDNYYVLTNRHVIRGAATEAIRINLADGRRIHPTTVREDPATDVAVLEISAPDLTAAPLGDSDKTDIGDFVLAVGSPFGLSQSVTFGIISAKGRRALRLGEVQGVEFQDFMQTDAPINPGNSGGPLVNLRGEVIGINTAIASNSGGNEGIGFAIPINMFMTVGRQLIETGKVVRGFLGVNLSPNFGPAQAAEMGLPRPLGAYVTGTEPNSPAEAAKFRPGDVIIEFNRVQIEDRSHLTNLVRFTPIGKSVPVVVFRDRKPLTIIVEVGDASQFKP